MSLMDKLKRRSDLQHREEDGLDLAATIVDSFEDRKFRVTGPGLKARGVDGEEVARFLQEELPDYYTYVTRITTYTDRQAGAN